MAAPGRSHYLVWCGLGLAIALVYTLVEQRPTDRAEELSPQRRLELFRKVSPAARLRLVNQLPRSEEAFHKVTVGNVVASIVERGTLEPTIGSYIYCRVKAPTKQSTISGVVKWVIEDGTIVKECERVLELDSSDLEEQLAAQKVACKQALAARTQAEEDLNLVLKPSQVDVRLDEIAVRLAELNRKKADGPDKERQEILALRLEQARLEAHFQEKVKQADAALQARREAAEEETTRLRDLEEQPKLCVMRAPHAGMVVYYVPENPRRWLGPILAEGEPVREGQKLMQIWDLKRMQVKTHIQQTLMSQVHPGQKVRVRVDAFPDKPLVGTVTYVSCVLGQNDKMVADNDKGYETLVALADEVPGLKPGMSAEVRILLEERVGVVQVPVQAVVSVGSRQVCYVKTAAGIEERQVVTGLLSTDFAIEIKAGLGEGEHVLVTSHLLQFLDLKPAK